MTIADRNLLIVEDDEEWRMIYARAGTGLGMRTIKTASNLKEAQKLLEEMKFSVAFVDIGLDVDDDRNVDGLRVMEEIRSRGDETSLIVVTGRSGRDVLPITRDAIKKYDAFDAVGKVPIEPRDIAELLQGGQRAYKKAVGANRISVHEVLRGNLESWDWDDRILRSIRIRGGPTRLYSFLDQLFEDFLPVAAREPGHATSLDDNVPVAYAEYWSRAVGGAISVCFGSKEHTDQAIEENGATRRVLGRFEVGDILRQTSAGDINGFVFALIGERRENFHGN